MKLYQTIKKHLLTKASYLIREELKNDFKYSNSLSLISQEVARTVYSRTDGFIFYGPFTNLKLLPESNLSLRSSIMIGSYEEELHEILYKICINRPSKVIDIGSEEGYYLVGLAVANPGLKLVGFEKDNTSRNSSIELAKFNNVSNQITFNGNCDLKNLNEVIVANSFILCDIEGGEIDLIDPTHCAELVNCDLLIELHDFYNNNIITTLVERFNKTHKIEIIQEAERNPLKYRVLNGFSDLEKTLAIREIRYIESRLTTAKFMYLKRKCIDS
jgi:hypothetical protein